MDTRGLYPRFPWPEFGHTSIGHTLPETTLSDNNRPDFRSRIDWAKMRAAAGAAQLNRRDAEAGALHMAHGREHRGGFVLVMCRSLWVWIYWGLPRVPDADALWALNRQESVMFVDQRRRNPRRARSVLRPPRSRLNESPIMCRRLSSRSRTAASMNTRASIAWRCCAPCSRTCAPAKPCRAARR
jgi:hypothetical protein